jgi:exo-beta-1,3-glucanase (GH17 family)
MRSVLIVLCISALPLLQSCGGDASASSSTTSTPYTLATRSLPSVYTSGTSKAINYHPYRGAGPGTSDTPTDANILEDLGLMSGYGINLIRLFGSDTVHTRILDLASTNYPALKFQLGIYLRVPASCASDAVNDSQISTAITLATTRANVVAVSVGNEPSLTNWAILMSCMEGYVKRVKQYVPQPITADDDFSLYARNRIFNHNGVIYSAANFLPWLDFLSVHTYPQTNYNDWGWTTKRADADTLMTAAVNEAKANFAAVKNYSFKNSSGVTTTVAAAMPIIIGETGWKAKQTNPNNPLETAAAKPQNAKWYFDLMNAWQADGTGPKTIFYFSSFDETWKGSDDGWGLWDKDRAPRYALCGTAATNAPTCTTPVYLGAGF